MTVPMTNHLTTREAAKYINNKTADLSLSTGDIRNLINTNFPNAYKNERGNWLIPQSDLDEYLNNFPNHINKIDSLTKWERFRRRPYIFWPLLVLGVLITAIGLLWNSISGVADLGEGSKQLNEWGIVREFEPRKDGEILIVIATFYTGPGEADSTLQDELYIAINDQITDLNMSDTLRVEVDRIVIPARDFDKAKQRAQWHDATIIIWGDDTSDLRITTNFLNLTAPELDLSNWSKNENEAIRAAPYPEYLTFVIDELSPQIKFLTLFATANAFLSIDNEFSIQLLSQILSEDETKLLPQDFILQTDEAWFILGSAYFQKNMLVEAMESYNKALELNPKYVSAYVNRGIIYYPYQRDSKSAIEDFNEALILEPENDTAILSRGNAYFGNGDFDAALEDYTLLLDYDPEIAGVYSNIGGVHLAMGNLMEAIKNFDQAINLDPKHAYFYINRGIAYYHQNEFDKAIADFNQVLLLNPENTQALGSRGRIYFIQGDYPKAISDFNQALLLDPEDSYVISSRGEIYFEQGELEAALDDFGQAIALDSKNVMAYVWRGQIHVTQGNYQKAISDFTQALALESNLDFVYNDRGTTYIILGNLTAAISDFTEALAINPELIQSYDNRGAAYLVQGDYQAALNDFNQALVLDPEYALAYSHRGLLHHELGNRNEAIADLQRFIELAPNDSPLYYEAEGLLKDLGE